MRTQAGGLVYPALNPANRRLPLFTEPGHSADCLRTQVEHPVGLLAYCLMPNH